MGQIEKMIYYCDDCLDNVENKSSLIQVVYSLYSNSSGHIGKVEKEVCDKCFNNYYYKLYQKLNIKRDYDFKIEEDNN